MSEVLLSLLLTFELIQKASMVNFMLDLKTLEILKISPPKDTCFCTLSFIRFGLFSKSLLTEVTSCSNFLKMYFITNTRKTTGLKSLRLNYWEINQATSKFQNDF